MPRTDAYTTPPPSPPKSSILCTQQRQWSPSSNSPFLLSNQENGYEEGAVPFSQAFFNIIGKATSQIGSLASSAKNAVSGLFSKKPVAGEHNNDQDIEIGASGTSSIQYKQNDNINSESMLGRTIRVVKDAVGSVAGLLNSPAKKSPTKDPNTQSPATLTASLEYSLQDQKKESFSPAKSDVASGVRGNEKTVTFAVPPQPPIPLYEPYNATILTYVPWLTFYPAYATLPDDHRAGGASTVSSITAAAEARAKINQALYDTQSELDAKKAAFRDLQQELDAKKAAVHDLQQRQMFDSHVPVDSKARSCPPMKQDIELSASPVPVKHSGSSSLGASPSTTFVVALEGSIVDEREQFTLRASSR